MTPLAPQMRQGSPADLPAILSLLRSAGLPTEDLPGKSGLRTWVLECGGSLRGVIALEPYGSEGLLRSLAVDPGSRRSGLGRALVSELERHASRDGITTLVLLTQTAESFFRRLGYEPLDRTRVSEALSRSAEFRSLCPASATCMVKRLNGTEAESRRELRPS